MTVIISSSTKPYEANLFKIDHIKIFLVIGTYTRMDREVFITSTAASRSQSQACYLATEVCAVSS